MEVWRTFGRKWCLKCFDLKKCAQHEMKCSRSFLEVIFFGAFFGQIWRNLRKNPLHPQTFAWSYTYGLGRNVSTDTMESNTTVVITFSSATFLRMEIMFPVRQCFCLEHKSTWRTQVFQKFSWWRLSLTLDLRRFRFRHSVIFKFNFWETANPMLLRFIDFS